jgi:hypothetical protein
MLPLVLKDGSGDASATSPPGSANSDDAAVTSMVLEMKTPVDFAVSRRVVHPEMDGEHISCRDFVAMFRKYSVVAR